jgi:hypothetical protein
MTHEACGLAKLIAVTSSDFAKKRKKQRGGVV